MDILVSESSDQQRLKAQHDLLNEIDHVMQCWENRLTLDNPRLVEHYLKIRLNLLVRFRIDLIDVDCLALFRRADEMTGIEDKLRVNAVARSNVLVNTNIVNAVKSGCGCY